MKQGIHNALYAAVRDGVFHPCTIDAKIGTMTVDSSKAVKPQGITIKEVKSQFTLAQSLRRKFGAVDRTAWKWVAIVQFSREVSCEQFEETVSEEAIKIPTEARTLIAYLAESTYEHPPEQSASNGTVVEFVFEVVAQILRK